MGQEKKAAKDLKTGLKKFREDALKKGWEEDEVDAKITEVFENFPWYKYNKPQTSWKSRIGKFFLYSFIIYLAIGAVLERNRRWKKQIDDYIFDSQISYHSQRFLRILTLPLFNIHDLSQYHDQECLIKNPFREEEEFDCGFCEGIEKMPTLSIESPDVLDMIAESEPVVVTNVPNYFDKKVTFNDFKNMFKENRKELDLAVCRIAKNQEFKKVSDFFDKMEESTTIEKNVSIEWSNCDTYGTRFYRTLFQRPKFVAKEAEIHFEKRVYMLQKDQNSTFPSFEGKSYYLYQVQGSSEIELYAPDTCHYNCTSEPIKSIVKTGEIAVFANNGWMSSFKTIGDGLNIAFLSSFT